MDGQTLSSPPSLLPLYAKALVGSVLPGGGDELPEGSLAVEDLEIDRDHLAKYARVCGFALGESLPPTYPHILGFPLAMAIMTAREFPFSLLGMVHIANRIEQQSPIPVEARPSVGAWAENMRPHRRGRQLDLVTQASVDGEVVWVERSTYLRRGSDGDEAAADDREELIALADRAEAVAAEWKVPGDIGRRYADVSGDRNPIHLHSLAAKPFGFPGAIAHGMWMKGRCLAHFAGRLPGALTAEVEFRAPLRIPGRVRLVTVEEGGRRGFRLEGADGERVHMRGLVNSE